MMTTVDTSELEDDLKQDLPQFVESKLAVKSERDGDKIAFEDKNERTHVSTPEIKTYLKRFMHDKDLRKRYRLLSTDGNLKFVKLAKEEIEANEEK